MDGQQQQRVEVENRVATGDDARVVLARVDKIRTRHAKWSEDARPDVVFVRTACHRFDHGAEHEVAGVAVDAALPRSRGEPPVPAHPLGHQDRLTDRWIPRVADPADEVLRRQIAHARGMRQQLPDRDVGML